MNSIKDRILIVESNPEISDFLARQALSNSNYQVFQVADASSAINKAIQINPDLIISNISLPGLSGKDLLIALSSHGITPPTIMLAPEGQESEIIQAFRLGAADYITWPLRDTEVVLVVERLLQQVRERRQHLILENQLRLTNQQLQQRVKELTAIFTIGKSVTSTTNHKQLFDKILQISAQVSQSDLGWLLMRQEEKGKNFLFVAQHNLPDIFKSKINNKWDDGISSLVAISGETLNISGDPIKRFKVKVFGESIIIVPVKIQRQVMGLLVLMRKQSIPFSQSEQRLLEAVADYASISLVTTKMFRSFEAREHTLSKLVIYSQNNEKILDELFNKTKTNLVQFSTETQKSWLELEEVMEDKDNPDIKTRKEFLESNIQEIQFLASLVPSDPFFLNTNQNQKFDLNVMMKDLKSSFLPITQHHRLKIETEFLIHTLNITADPNQIYQVLQGIITNAIQFCEPQGRILLKTNRYSATEALLSISNTGKLPEIIKNQILDPKSHPEKQNRIRFGGIGISLDLIHKLVIQSDGRIWVEGHIDNETTFHILLPAME
ncbi:MAG: response regulator [Anaerolineaceae bacterium]|nr:response regulator [Anaerolineaceae bacterium]